MKILTRPSPSSFLLPPRLEPADNPSHSDNKRTHKKETLPQLNPLFPPKLLLPPLPPSPTLLLLVLPPLLPLLQDLHDSLGPSSSSRPGTRLLRVDYNSCDRQPQQSQTAEEPNEVEEEDGAPSDLVDVLLEIGSEGTTVGFHHPRRRWSRSDEEDGFVVFIFVLVLVEKKSSFVGGGRVGDEEGSRLRVNEAKDDGFEFGEGEGEERDE